MTENDRKSPISGVYSTYYTSDEQKKILKEAVALSEKYPKGMYCSSRVSATLSGMCYYDRGVVINGPTDKVGCLIGQAIQNVGLPIPNSSVTIHNICQDSKYKQCLCKLQNSQDAGISWGEGLSNNKQIIDKVLAE